MKRRLLCIIIALALPCAAWTATVITAVATIAPESASAAAAYAIPDGFWAGGTEAAPGSLLTIIHTGTGKSVVVTAVSFPLTDPEGRIFLSPRAATMLGIPVGDEATISIVAGALPATPPAAVTPSGKEAGTPTGGTLDPDEDMSLLARANPAQPPATPAATPSPASTGEKPAPVVATTEPAMPAAAPPPVPGQAGTAQRAPVIPGSLRPASEQPTSAAPLSLGEGVFLPMNTGASSSGAASGAPRSAPIAVPEQTPQSTIPASVPTTQKPQPAPASPAVSAPGSTPSGVVFLQVGIFSSQPVLRKTMDYFMPFFPLEIRLVPGKGSASYRLLVGPLEPTQIEQAKQRAREKGITDAFLTDR